MMAAAAGQGTAWAGVATWWRESAQLRRLCFQLQDRCLVLGPIVPDLVLEGFQFCTQPLHRLLQLSLPREARLQLGADRLGPLQGLGGGRQLALRLVREGLVVVGVLFRLGLQVGDIPLECPHPCFGLLVWASGDLRGMCLRLRLRCRR